MSLPWRTRRGVYLIFFLILVMFDPMSDLQSGGEAEAAANSHDDIIGLARPPAAQGGGYHGHSGGAGGRFADDIHSVTIHARQRTFYIDLKQSGNGKFFKISEKSRGGQKTTIMFDVEDLDKFIEALQEMKTKM
ncbi:MAG: hypothetical protein JWM56_809 [Candidatus Peribacteria bacterium]|nr:hypothetical protein [Candidatus Peribacteria bacterium]